jgi:D-beta-D-heptose 7-phosphate kinase / D-beta-D-heptose 1-phosphate adenosyltransferase
VTSSNHNSYDQVVDQIRHDGFDRFGNSGYNRIIFTNGCFDLLHVGHVKLLNECRSLAGPRGAVVVGVNSDYSVRKLKGLSRPFIDEVGRATILTNLKSVDYVIVFEEETPYDLIKSLVPDLIVKGSDYKGKEIIGSDFSPVLFVELESNISTTSIAKKIKENA